MKQLKDRYSRPPQSLMVDPLYLESCFGGQPLKRQKRDDGLQYYKHCDMITNSAGRALGKILSKFAYFRNIGFTTFEKLFQTNVELIMSYGVSCIGLKKYDFEKIQARAIRCFLRVHPKTPIPALFGKLGWISFKFCQFK